MVALIFLLVRVVLMLKVAELAPAATVTLWGNRRVRWLAAVKRDDHRSRGHLVKGDRSHGARSAHNRFRIQAQR